MTSQLAVQGNGEPLEIATEPLSSISAEGSSFVNASGEKVNLRGVNLGNWFLIESWMLGIGDIPDQHTFFSILDVRFGAEKREELINLYRSNWITARDFKLIQGFGMNTVRLPFHYSMLIDKTEPESYRENGFAWLDHAISLARANNLYVILDLHGAPGGQSVDQPTGKIDSNELWDSAKYQDMTVNIWEELALRYMDEPAIAAYDILNEPYGEGPRSGIEDILKNLCERIYHTIRATGDEHVILFPGTQEGIFFYDSPTEMNAHNLGFTEHFYPGIFHAEPSIEGHARFISDHLTGRHELLQTWKAPFLVGEFNVVFNHTGGDRMMRHYWDLYESYGWAATMWSYKLIKDKPGVEDDNWYIVTNKNPIDIPDIRTASIETIEAFFKSLGTMKLSADEQLLEKLNTLKPPRFELPDFPNPLRTAPKQDVLKGWQLNNLADATPSSGLELKSDGAFKLYAGGDDIFGKFDSCGYLWQPVSKSFAIEAEFTSLEATERFAKAGLMLRKSNNADSPMLFFNAFKDGSIALCYRKAKGQFASETKFEAKGWPIQLRIDYQDGVATPSFKQSNESWHQLSPVSVEANTAGIASVSGDLNQIATAQVANFRLSSLNSADKSL
ncbi:glycoside hydrolase family 5 protein [Rubellicoccus peritrichatus]|uniref:Cellulase family glycosylhydrolase n=1 Tax=Rubellicoccus peritrichatus TaxID=3080537 RepID=A0AAQ3LDG0_9BACT|nr:cellulase family glycosylhydrolase [Puniceicoccus sp. CR14]WOO43347.1 cellulase family glycosylhydrolase [Puniceicoccus sp. CR14]